MTDRFPPREIFDFNEHNAVLDLCKKFKIETFAEIGVLYGSLANFLLSQYPFTEYFAIDNWLSGNYGLESYPQEAMDHVYNECKKNLEQYLNVEILKMSSLSASHIFQAKTIDMVFIDASHEEADVVSDIYNWSLNAIKIIAGHDYYLKPVKKAVDRMFDKVNIIDTKYQIWWKEL